MVCEYATDGSYGRGWGGVRCFDCGAAATNAADLSADLEAMCVERHFDHERADNKDIS